MTCARLPRPLLSRLCAGLPGRSLTLSFPLNVTSLLFPFPTCPQSSSGPALCFHEGAAGRGRRRRRRGRHAAQRPGARQPAPVRAPRLWWLLLSRGGLLCPSQGVVLPAPADRPCSCSLPAAPLQVHRAARGGAHKGARAADAQGAAGGAGPGLALPRAAGAAGERRLQGPGRLQPPCRLRLCRAAACECMARAAQAPSLKRPACLRSCPSPLYAQVGEVGHAAQIDGRPGGRQAWAPRVANIR